ncbi:hypothetical protein BGZ54_001640 [Gamsiella multidivaricata]|nr:hypothetical protein BGZ54_001640 [Gamsiella multidivaricata]
MQFKTLALAAVAVASVNALSFDNNTCTQCVFGSFDKDPSCSTLSAADLKELTDNFNPANLNVTGIAAAIQKPATRACVCHWSTTAFTATGAASSCTSGATPVCNSTQIGEATAGISGLTPILHCDASSTPTASASASASASAPAGSTPTTTKSMASSIQMNMPYVLSVAALGLAALAGL